MADMVGRGACVASVPAATQIDQRLVALHRNLFVESNPIPVKVGAGARMGLMGGTLRLPLTELSPEYHAVVTESLFAAGIRRKWPPDGVELLKSEKVARLRRIAAISPRHRPVRGAMISGCKSRIVELQPEQQGLRRRRRKCRRCRRRRGSRRRTRAMPSRSRR